MHFLEKLEQTYVHYAENPENSENPYILLETQGKLTREPGEHMHFFKELTRNLENPYTFKDLTGNSYIIRGLILEPL